MDRINVVEEAKLHLNSSGRKEKAEQRGAQGGSNQLVANTCNKVQTI